MDILTALKSTVTELADSKKAAVGTTGGIGSVVAAVAGLQWQVAVAAIGLTAVIVAAQALVDWRHPSTPAVPTKPTS